MKYVFFSQKYQDIKQGLWKQWRYHRKTGYNR